MPQIKKDGKYLNVKIDRGIYDKLGEISSEAGQSKTTVVERALLAYFNDFEMKQKTLHELEMDVYGRVLTRNTEVV